jgi:hypothetical protein
MDKSAAAREKCPDVSRDELEYFFINTLRMLSIDTVLPANFRNRDRGTVARGHVQS